MQVIIVPNRKDILGTSKITIGYATSLPEEVRNHLSVKSGDTIAFFHDKENNLIILSTEGKNVLGSTKLTTTNNITLREEVRKILPIEVGKKILYILELDGRISLHTHLD